jgi:hypothetical protein
VGCVVGHWERGSSAILCSDSESRVCLCSPLRPFACLPRGEVCGAVASPVWRGPLQRTRTSHLAPRISHLAGLSAPVSKRPLGLQSWAHLEGRPASPIGGQPEGCSPSVQPSTLFSWDVSQSRVPIQAHDGEGGLLMRDAQKRA